MNAYVVEGDFQMGRLRQPFAIQVVTADEDAARERTFTEIGSRHGRKRRDIAIASVKQIGEDQAHFITRHRMRE